MSLVLGMNQTGRACICGIALVLVSVPTARGGFVFFEPENAVIDRRIEQPGSLTIDVSFSSFYPFVDTLSVLIGSDGPVFTGFQTDPTAGAFFEPCQGCSIVGLPPGPGVYANELELSGHTSILPAPPAMYLGRLAVDLSNLADGEYRLVVDGFFDGGRSLIGSNGSFFPLIGVAQITIVPEPATLGLLTVGIALAARGYGKSRKQKGRPIYAMQIR